MEALTKQHCLELLDIMPPLYLCIFVNIKHFTSQRQTETVTGSEATPNKIAQDITEMKIARHT